MRLAAKIEYRVFHSHCNAIVSSMHGTSRLNDEISGHACDPCPRNKHCAARGSIASCSSAQLAILRSAQPGAVGFVIVSCSFIPSRISSCTSHRCSAIDFGLPATARPSPRRPDRHRPAALLAAWRSFTRSQRSSSRGAFIRSAHAANAGVGPRQRSRCPRRHPAFAAEVRERRVRDAPRRRHALHRRRRRRRNRDERSRERRRARGHRGAICQPISR